MSNNTQLDVVNLTRNTSDFALLGAVNASLPALQLASSSGAKIALTISVVSGIIIAIFIIALIGNAVSILLSILALFAPSNALCRNLGAGITMLSTQMLQIAAFTSTSILSGISSCVNGTTDIFGISVITGSKHLTFL